ncbi:phosphopantetheine-binding protein [Butyrivibrio sp. AE3004]|uniref:phosphopantetheine-binding protein n=1 Tax=Butyrivibrio sp. AE3004 TaxID=1506994 RepID=UPI000494076A|nr:phosphopantetheine-binding protein [Butyrivibrio sp. AE3004]
MSKEMKFKEIIAQYCEVSPKDMKNALRFREDLGFSSLDFMSFLGELEDEFDVELEQERATQIHTVGEALELLDELRMAG